MHIVYTMSILKVYTYILIVYRNHIRQNRYTCIIIDTTLIRLNFNIVLDMSTILYKFSWSVSFSIGHGCYKMRMANKNRYIILHSTVCIYIQSNDRIFHVIADSQEEKNAITQIIFTIIVNHINYCIKWHIALTALFTGCRPCWLHCSCVIWAELVP